jgi:UDP-N-acetylmuramoyl-tripeptide--D-alanyl-D-alanine ligase
MKADLVWVAGALRRAGYRGPDPHAGAVTRVSIDTRADCSGALFVALAGANADGHEYLREAIERGAVALLVARSRLDEAVAEAGNTPVFDVPDTLAGLQAIASAWRERVNPRVIAVTGSTGKTGTKDFAAAILARRFAVHATPGNLNNHIGLPLTILGMEDGAEICVTEMGANHRKEITALCDIAKPAIGVVTNIGPAHLEYFGSLKGVAAAKAELVEALPPSGTAVLPADDEFASFLASRTRARAIAVGFSESADRRIAELEGREGGGYRFRIGDILLEIGRHGRHHIMNAAMAAVVGEILEIPPLDIAAAVAETHSAPGRGAVYDIAGILFMDESYNANPASLRAAVDAFAEMAGNGRRWFVLGDMLELGAESAELHREAGVYCGRAKSDGILTLGTESVELSRAAAEQRKSPEHITHFIDANALAAHLDGLLRPGDLVLIKGSRLMRMETIMDRIEQARGARRRRIN